MAATRTGLRQVTPIVDGSGGRNLQGPKIIWAQALTSPLVGEVGFEERSDEKPGEGGSAGCGSPHLALECLP
ncbi:hypothetical protein SAMN05519104_4518 [Rhizobiales bacterium GAS188]|nr:hypothetical protein SAMN05519104_4518 [Rhizobiales bacterium GAS188]